MSFGLLYGIGFAAVIGEIGILQSEIPTSLLFFNVGVEIGQPLFFAPDFWFGIILVFIGMSAITGGGPAGRYNEETFGQDFLTPYATTLVEGVLISISLVFIAFITLIILNFRRNRHQLPSQHFPQA